LEREHIRIAQLKQHFLAVTISISFASFSLQMKREPYKHWEDNLFKATVEVHIFLLVSIALVLKCFKAGLDVEADEVLSIGFYDVLLIGSFVVGILMGFVGTVYAKRAMIKAALHEVEAPREGVTDHIVAKQRTIRLLQLGLTSNDDMRLLVGETDFWSEAHAAFGGIQALPTSTSAATMEKVIAHLGQTTGDDSTAGLRELLRQVGGDPEPTVQGLVACILKFQGVKLSKSGAAPAHSHGRTSVGVDDLAECTGRIQATVASCLNRVSVAQLTK
jgi:hypothetical protein